MVVEETGIVVVVNKQTKGVNIFEMTGLCVETLLDTTHVLAITKNIVDGVVHWVVEKTSDVVLVGTDVSRVAVEDLTHLEDSSRGAKFRPEVLGDLGDSVDAKTIEAVRACEVLNPVFKGLTDP